MDDPSQHRDPGTEGHPLRHVLLGGRRTRLGLVVVGTALWFAFALVFMWEWALWPRSLVAWIVILAVGPVAYLTLSALGELVAAGFRRIPAVRATRAAVVRSTAAVPFSWLRIAYLLFETILYLAVLGSAVAAVAWATGWHP